MFKYRALGPVSLRGQLYSGVIANEVKQSNHGKAEEIASAEVYPVTAPKP